MSASKEGEQLQAGESLIVSATDNGVTFDSSTTLTAVTLADGTQAFVAQDLKLDPGSGVLFCLRVLNICKVPSGTTSRSRFGSQF
jgi:hypothetical protein